MKSFFATNLKFLRKQHGDTQKTLAKKINEGKKDEDKVHFTTIGRWENGNRDPNVGGVIAISELYNIPVVDLYYKDLRISCDFSVNDNKKALKELFKRALIEKGYMTENEDITDEKFDYLFELYNINKKFW